MKFLFNWKENPHSHQPFAYKDLLLGAARFITQGIKHKSCVFLYHYKVDFPIKTLPNVLFILYIFA